jgi:DNA invertase Pin-like site-specific DNA recombinase
MSLRRRPARRYRLHDLGWSEVEIIDDLGCSTADTIVRMEFERMVADVGRGKLGVVAAWEVSWFTRNRRDWRQLIEICRMVDTLLIDQKKGLYSPTRAMTACCQAGRASEREQARSSAPARAGRAARESPAGRVDHHGAGRLLCEDERPAPGEGFRSPCPASDRPGVRQVLQTRQRLPDTAVIHRAWS